MTLLTWVLSHVLTVNSLDLRQVLLCFAVAFSLKGVSGEVVSITEIGVSEATQDAPASRATMASGGR